MSIDATTFKVRFPEFSAVANARIDLFIGDAVEVLNEVYWDNKYDLGLYYLTAHYLALASQTEAGNVTGDGGAVASRAVDGTSVSFTTAQPDNESDAYYSQTAYGRRYLSLRKNLDIPAYSI